MLTVVVWINDEPIIRTSAQRIEGEPSDETCLYRTDRGVTFKHQYSKGAAVLAQKLLELHDREERQHLKRARRG